jgi:hypothetical protein
MQVLHSNLSTHLAPLAASIWQGKVVTGRRAPRDRAPAGTWLRSCGRAVAAGGSDVGPPQQAAPAGECYLE